MKKKIIIIILLVMTICGCQKDYKKYSFTDINWIRNNEHDIETIKFNSNGNFSYYCSCGNPINDADLCETYTYNDKTKEIKLNCIETTEDTIKTIKIIKYNEKELELDFNGERKIFNIETKE